MLRDIRKRVFVALFWWLNHLLQLLKNNNGCCAINPWRCSVWRVSKLLASITDSVSGVPHAWYNLPLSSSPPCRLTKTARVKIAFGECLWSLPVVGGKWWIETITSFNTKYPISTISSGNRSAGGGVTPPAPLSLTLARRESHVQKGIVSNTELTGPKALGPKWISTEVFPWQLGDGIKDFCEFRLLKTLSLSPPTITYVHFHETIQLLTTGKSDVSIFHPGRLGLKRSSLGSIPTSCPPIWKRSTWSVAKSMDAKCSNPSIPIWSIHLHPPQIETERNIMVYDIIKWTNINLTIYICDNHGLKHMHACV